MAPNDVDVTWYHWKITHFFSNFPGKPPVTTWAYELVNFWRRFPEWKPVTSELLVEIFTRYERYSSKEVMDLLMVEGFIQLVDGAFVPSATLLQYLEKFHNMARPEWKEEMVERRRTWEAAEARGRAEEREHRQRRQLDS